MRKVIFIDSASQAEKIVGNSVVETKFIVLNEVPEANRIREVLKRNIRFQELDKRVICARNYPNLRDEYIRFIGQLNARNASLFWWSYFFTNKSPVGTNLFYDLANLLVLNQALTQHFDRLIVVTNRRQLLKYITRIRPLKSSLLKDLISAHRQIWKSLRIFAPFLLILKSLRLILFKCLLLLYGSAGQWHSDTSKSYTAIRSIVTEKSFAPDGDYKDIYFGELVGYLLKKDMPFIIAASLSGSYLRLLRRIRKLKGPLMIIPNEYWLSWAQIWKTLFISLQSCFMPQRVKGETRISGVDVRGLIRDSMIKDICSTAIFSHIESYYSMQSFAKKANIRKLIYPMENRPWERMMIQAVRAFGGDCWIVGYQHASIGLKHMNFEFTAEERAVNPFPDQVITIGEPTKEIVNRGVGGAIKKVDVGCALRQSAQRRIIKNKPRTISNILVALATNLEEYTETLLFIEASFWQSDNFKIRIRPHPTISIAPIVKYLRSPEFRFEIGDNTTIKEDLAWSDLVIYVSSTVSLEALSLGIPVLYLDVDPFLSRDPLYNMQILKWTARVPQEVISTVKSIEQMEADDYAARQAKTLDYVMKYLLPIDEECLKKFI